MSSPRMTVRSFAEIFRKPSESPVRILHDQKYPQQDPQVFRTPYYQKAISAIRNYYRAGNDHSVLKSARNQALSIANEARRANTLRVLDAFSSSAHAKRRFDVTSNRRFAATVGKVEIRLSADMQAHENGELRILYFHCRGIPIEEETATLMAEIAHWVMERNAIEILPRQVEVMDVSEGRSHRARSWRDSTVAALSGRARSIASIWDQI
jgi:hypothetical protein